MAKPRRRPKPKATRRARKPHTLKAWIERQFLSIPELRERVDAMMREMLRERAHAGRKRKSSGQVKARKRARPRP